MLEEFADGLEGERLRKRILGLVQVLESVLDGAVLPDHLQRSLRADACSKQTAA
jgi:hypothetical protein